MLIPTWRGMMSRAEDSSAPRYKKNRQATHRTFRPSVEMLESRVLLATDTLDVTAGVLTYTGGNAVNTLAVSLAFNNVTNRDEYNFSDTGNTILLTANAEAAGFQAISPSSVTGPASNVSSINLQLGNQANTLNLGPFGNTLAPLTGAGGGNAGSSATVLASGQGISVANGNLSLGGFNTITVNNSINIFAAGGKLTLNADATTAGTVTTSSSGDLQGNAGVTITGGGGISLGANIGANNNNINLMGPTMLTSSIGLNPGNGNTTFNNSLNGAFGLTLNGQGTSAFNGPVGAVAPLTSVFAGNGSTVAINGGAVMTTGGQSYDGNLTLGASAIVEAGALDVTGTVTALANNLTVTSNSIAFNGGASSVSGSGALALQPRAANGSIGVAGGAGTLQINAANLAALANGFSGITIGRSDGAGAINVNAVTFMDPVTLQTPMGGSINLNGTLTGAGNASVNLSAANGTNNLSANIVTNGNAATISGGVMLGAAMTVMIDTTNGGLAANGAGVAVNGAINAASPASSLTVAGGSQGAVDLQGAVGNIAAPMSLSVVGATARFGGNVTTLGAQTVAAATIRTNGIHATTNSNVMFQGNVVLQNTTSLNAGSGNITVTGTANGAFDLNTSSTGTTLLSGAIGATTPLQSLSIAAGGATQLNGGAITTTGPQNFGNSFKFGGNTTLQATSANFLATSTFNVDLSSASPQLIVNGDVALNQGGLNVNLIGGFIPQQGQMFLVIDDSGALTGQFNGLPDDALLILPGNVVLQVQYASFQLCTISSQAVTAPTQTNVVANPPTGTAGTNITLTATVLLTTLPDCVAVGTVTFQVTGLSDQIVGLSQGTAQFIFTPATSQPLQINCVYNPDPNSTMVTSNKGLNLTVNPVAINFAPTSGAPGASVVITGADFTGVSAVTFGGTSASITINPATQINAIVPAGASTGPVVVSKPGGVFGSSGANNFTVQIPAPTITGFSPISGTFGSQVVITGTNFTGANAVAFNGLSTLNFNVDSATQITATVPNGATTGPIGVSTPGGITASTSNFFLPPTISGFTPANGSVGTIVTITGINFNNANAVAFSGTPTPTFTVDSPTQITATVPAGAATGAIGVSTPGGIAESSTNFIVTASLPPTISGFTPASGPIGTQIIITGTNFTGTSAVTFGGAPANFTVNSATQITATVPAAAVTGALGVSTPGGDTTTTSNFTVTAPLPPTIAGFSPPGGETGIGVVITGTALQSITAVTFNGQSANFNINSATQITATVPAGATTGPIAVSGPGGVATSAASFVVLSPANSIYVTGADAGGGPDVKVFDGQTNQLKLEFFAFSPNFTGGVRVGTGDVDADGFPDIITAAGPGGGPNIAVYSGKDVRLLFSFFAYSPNFTGGVYISGGDVNGDGFSDIICGADAGGGPNITVFSGKDQAQTMLASFFAYSPNFTGGVRVAGGDVNGDGKADIVCGAGPGGGPNVTVFSGADFAILASFFAYSPAFTAGIYVGAGDVNGDGKADVICGAGPGGGPNVTVFSIGGNQSTSILASFFAYDAGFTGGVRVAGVDRNGDGQADVVAVPGPGGGPNVRTLDVLSATVIDSFFAYNAAFTGGLYVAATER